MKLKTILILVMAIIAVSGSIGAAYACYELPGYSPCPPYCPPGQVDLKIRDQDEPWSDGVRATWTASDMAPGDEFAFTGCFVGLRGKFPSQLKTGMLDVTCNYNAWTALQPDNMAKYMEITRCTYNYTNGKEKWQINLLTGKATKTLTQWTPSLPANKDWQVHDVDRDGRVTFCDLKRRPLKNLPSIPNDDARFEMSIRFNQGAGNEFQADTFVLTMIYTLTAR